MGLSTDRGDRPRLLGDPAYSAGATNDGMTAAMTAATGGMTVAMTGATGAMTARTAVPAPDCYADEPKRALSHA